MRRFAIQLLLEAGLVAMLCLFAAPAYAGGDCPGMTDYSYANGSCTENGVGDFFNVMQKAYDREYQLGTDRIQRMEDSAPSQSTPIRSGSSSLNAKLAARMVYTSQAHVLYPAWYATQAYPHNAQAREHLTQALTILVDNYRRTAGNYGFNPRLLPDAAAMYIMAAYRVFNGDHYSDAVSARLGAIRILTWMAHNPRVLSLDNAGRQFLAESYAVRAQVLTLLYGDALKRHDRMQIHALRSLARSSLQQELGVDPSTVTLDRLACLGSHPFSCENYLVFMRPAVGGRTTTVQEMRRVISPMAP